MLTDIKLKSNYEGFKTTRVMSLASLRIIALKHERGKIKEKER
ncbi:hypothetical protein O5404_05620 (plasmid) [Borrelia miyamotoi]|uniref:Uncharacterized protein n=1 Tax=Borrelia miyamotoi TaxID=47466 RepID=A0AAX3JP45_9SPIR|nr:hypothetical protein [Borrelia miyamotoi]WAZ72494.1 hypothetical protein O5404_05620 [Borrelia miyamotoi]WVI05418.1 hypothetical protein F9Y91_00935 [Borrelia miyamotoi]